MKVEEVVSTEGLEALAPEWAQLWRRDARATPFQSPAWLIPWWRRLGEGELWTLAFRDSEGGPLVGLAPMYVHTGESGSARRVFPVGVATSDYLDLLSIPGRGCNVASAVMAHVFSQQAKWDEFEWSCLRPDSPLLDTLAPDDLEGEINDGEPCPVLRLEGARELCECVPKRLMRIIRQCRRRAEADGGLRVRRAEGDDAHELFDVLVRLHGERWSARGLPGVLAQGAVEAMHREALSGLCSLGVLRLYALELGGRVIAVLYALAGGGRVYSYLDGFDRAFGRLSPGTLVIACAIEDALREGAAAFDFLRGREEFKYRWGAEDAAMHRRRIWQPSCARL